MKTNKVILVCTECLSRNYTIAKNKRVNTERLELNKYCINDELEFYETDEMISRMNKELIFNNINVYRIYESENSLEKEFFDMVNNDKTNK